MPRRAAVRLLSAVYNAAVLDRRVSASPVVKITLPRDEGQRVVPLTVAQVRALAEAMPARVRAMVYVQAGLGLRVGELLALRVQDVDFLRRTVPFEHQLERGTRARVDPKTPRSRRTIPLPAMVAESLAAHIAAHPPLPDGTLFYGEGARPFGHDYYGSRLFSGAVDKLAGLPGSTFPAATTTHDLRHHYASVPMAAGESVVAVAERLVTRTRRWSCRSTDTCCPTPRTAPGGPSTRPGRRPRQGPARLPRPRDGPNDLHRGSRAAQRSVGPSARRFTDYR